MTPSKNSGSLQQVRAFGVTWLGQLLSLIGTGLTHFALGIEIYRLAGSVTQLSLLTFFSLLPTALLSPIAGALIDRWDRRLVMLFSDLGAGLCMMLLWILIVAGESGAWPLRPWHFYGPVILSAALNAFRWPAFQASTTLLVPKEHLARANGLTELASGVGQLVSPLLAGALMTRIGLKGIVLLDLGSFAVAAVTLLLVRFPTPPPSALGQAARGSLWKEASHGWTFIRSRPGLFGLLLLLMMVNLIMGMVMVLTTPLVLGFADPATLGRILSGAGLGMLVGAITVSVWGGPRRRVQGMFRFMMLAGVALVSAGLHPNVWLIGLSSALFLFTLPTLSSCSHTIWQSKVPPDLQGRVFAVRRMMLVLAAPLASLLAGVLADGTFEPWLASGGPLADTVGRVVGTGPGRGIAFLFMALGVLLVAEALVAWQYPSLRNLEDELPEAATSPPLAS